MQTDCFISPQELCTTNANVISWKKVLQVFLEKKKNISLCFVFQQNCSRYSLTFKMCYLPTQYSFSGILLKIHRIIETELDNQFKLKQQIKTVKAKVS